MTTCLIVDDSKVVRMIARRIVEDLGFEGREAADGRAAIESCQGEIPDVVLLDWNMPVMNGLEFLLELRKMPGGGKPKVVFCTTENDIGQIEKAMAAGADEYVMKPFDADILEGKLGMIGVLDAAGDACL